MEAVRSALRHIESIDGNNYRVDLKADPLSSEGYQQFPEHLNVWCQIVWRHLFGETVLCILCYTESI